MKRLALLTLLLIVPADAFAITTVTRYLKGSCANNGDGTASGCAASGGAAGAYNSGTNAASDIASDYPDLTSSDVVINLNASDDTGDAPWALGPSVTTDATRRINIIADGTYKITSTVDDQCLFIRVADATVIGIECQQDTDAGDGIYVGNEATGLVILERNLIYGDTTTGGYGIKATGTGTGLTIKASNNIVYDFDVGIATFTQDNWSEYYYNNTVSDCNYGIQALYYGATDTCKFRGNVFQNSGTADYYSESTCASLTTAENITEDSSSPDGASWQTISLTFANAAANNFHLAVGDTAAIDQCSDLSADGDYSFTIDYDGDTRDATWDCGADEFGAGAGGGAAPKILHMDI